MFYVLYYYLLNKPCTKELCLALVSNLRYGGTGLCFTVQQLHLFYTGFTLPLNRQRQQDTKTNHALHYAAREYLRCCCQCKQQGLTHCSLAVHKQALSVKRKSKNNQEKVSIKLDTQVCLRETQYNLLARFIIADKKTNEKYKAALRTLCVITLPVCGGSVRASTIPCS